MVWLLILAPACLLAQRVEGTVIDSATGSGVAGAKVELVHAASRTGPLEDLVMADSGKAAYSAATDAQGRFRIDDVQNGDYVTRCRARMWMEESRSAFGSPASRASAAPFAVKAGTPVNLEIRMIHTATVSGRVVDGRGDPVPHARMDSRTGNLIGGFESDREGKFQMLLFPGHEYTLNVLPPVGWRPPDPDPETGKAKAWVRTWYPGVATREAAAKIVLPPGGEMPDVELKLAALPVHSVSGVVLTPDAKPAPKVPVELGETFRTPVFQTESKADGAFEFPAVVDGEWGLFAEQGVVSEKVLAAKWIEVSGRDMEDLKLELARRITLRGRVVMEAPKGQMPPRPPDVSLVRQHPKSVFMDYRLLAWPEADGTFVEEHGYPGVYELTAPQQLPSGYYLDSVRLGDAELYAPNVELTSGALQLTLVYKSDGGSVRGAVENCGGGGVLLVPQDPARRWDASILWARCDSNGRYEIASVRPGEYYALAFPGNEDRLLRPDLDDRMLTQASRVSVRSGEATSADLRPIR